MFRVAIDTTAIRGAHAVRGVGFYTENLLAALKKEEVGKGKFVGIKILEKGEGEYDLLHVPYFEPYFLTLPWREKAPLVVTIHDTIRLIYPEHYPPGVKGRAKLAVQKERLRRVKGVLTDSECSKKDIVRWLGVPQEKIEVVRLAAGRQFRQLKSEGDLGLRLREKYRLPERFVLYVGDVDWNKNVLGLVAAVKKIRMPMVIVGSQAVSEDYDRSHPEMQPLVRLQEEYGKDGDVIRLGFVPAGELVGIYNLATVYCQPSFYEGFGLPVLEAMACGCPVVCSKRASLVEIGNGAVEWIDPEDVGEMAEAIKRVVEDEKLRQDLRRRGLSWVKNFSWRKTAKETLAVYQKWGK